MPEGGAANASSVDTSPPPSDPGGGVLGIRRRLWADSPDGLHADLAQVILGHERQDPGLSVSNVGGWHSFPDLQHWTDPCVVTLLERIWAAAGALAAEPLRMHAWANVMRSGGHHLAHRHGEAQWSGVYYVAAGERDSGGAITFARGADSETITPRDGLMLLFPGRLLHSVATYRGTAPRVSVAFNLFP